MNGLWMGTDEGEIVTEGTIKVAVRVDGEYQEDIWDSDLEGYIIRCGEGRVVWVLGDGSVWVGQEIK